MDIFKEVAYLVRFFDQAIYTYTCVTLFPIHKGNGFKGFLKHVSLHMACDCLGCTCMVKQVTTTT